MLNERFKFLLKTATVLQEVLTYRLKDATREELTEKLDLTTSEIASMIKNNAVIL